MNALGHRTNIAQVHVLLRYAEDSGSAGSLFAIVRREALIHQFRGVLPHPSSAQEEPLT